MENKWRFTWLFALGAGWSGVLIVIASYLFITEPIWEQIIDGGSSGWTIYPPLSALPQAIPGTKQVTQLLLSTILCGSIFLGFWLLALLQRRHQIDKRSGHWFWLSLLLLVPMVVHIGGNIYLYRLKRNATEEMYQDYLQRQPQDLKEDSLDYEE
jgi:heme/copper-type cytochrome/quinol oxidase subunit 1